MLECDFSMFEYALFLLKRKYNKDIFHCGDKLEVMSEAILKVTVLYAFLK